MSTRALTVVQVNDNCAYLSGYGSRELITELRGGRPPVGSSVGRAWVTTAKTASDVIAVAESRGWAVTITNDDPLPASRGLLW